MSGCLSKLSAFGGTQLDGTMCLADSTSLCGCKCHSRGNPGLVSHLFKILLLIHEAIFSGSCLAIPQKTMNPIKADLDTPPWSKAYLKPLTLVFTLLVTCFLICVASHSCLTLISLT